jgi:hypothetical protein
MHEKTTITTRSQKQELRPENAGTAIVETRKGTVADTVP